MTYFIRDYLKNPPSKKVEPEVKPNEVSLENCASCTAAANNASPVVSGFSGTVNTGVPTGGPDDKKASATYDEGKGTKEIIQLTGPLSEVFTRALNIKFAKKPAFDSESVPDNISESELDELSASTKIAGLKSSVSKESQQQEESEMLDIIETLKKNNDKDELIDKFNFVHSNIVTDLKDTTPAVKVHMVPSTAVFKPSVIDVVQEDAEDKNKEVVLLITDETKFFAKGVGIKNKYLDLSENSTYNPVFNHHRDFPALESIYNGYDTKIIVGVESFLKYLCARVNKEQKA